MALEDQLFTKKPLVLLGPEFFTTLGDSIPDYAFCIQFREMERIHLFYDFHYVALTGVDATETFDYLQGWGVPVTLGFMFPTTIVKSSLKSAQTLQVLCEAMYSKSFSEAYRLTSPKDLSRYAPETVLEALKDSTLNPNPDTLFASLRRSVLPLN